MRMQGKKHGDLIEAVVIIQVRHGPWPRVTITEVMKGRLAKRTAIQLSPEYLLLWVSVSILQSFSSASSWDTMSGWKGRYPVEKAEMYIFKVNTQFKYSLLKSYNPQ
jgi:hypothetical protein